MAAGVNLLGFTIGAVGGIGGGPGGGGGERLDDRRREGGLDEEEELPGDLDLDLDFERDLEEREPEPPRENAEDVERGVLRLLRGGLLVAAVVFGVGLLFWERFEGRLLDFAGETRFCLSAVADEDVLLFFKTVFG